MTKKMNGAQAFFKTITEGGVDTIFCTPGTSEMQVVDEMGYSDLTCIMCLDENTVTGMADGYGRMLRRPALALVHVGAGLTNAMSSMHGARKAMTPMVVYSGHVAAYHECTDVVHIMKKRSPDIAAATTDWVYEAKSGDDLAQAGARAVEVANEVPGKIAMVYAPNNLAWADASLMSDPTKLRDTSRKVASSTISTIAEAIKAGQKTGKKTAFILGATAGMGDELEAAGRIAEGAGGTLFQEHFATARLHKGAGRIKVSNIPYESGDAQKLFSEYAQLVLIGAKVPMAEFTYKGKDANKIAPDTVVMTLASPDNNMLQAMNDLADALEAPKSASNRYERKTVEAPTGKLTCTSIEQTITALMPADTIVVDDGVMSTMMFRENTEGAEPFDLLPAPTGGQIGSGLPIAAGAAVACPDRKVILLSGDYTLMQCNTALWNLAAQNLDVLVVNYNNGGSAALEGELARVRRGEAQEKSLDMVHIRKPYIEYNKMAESMGVPSSIANTAEEFHAQFTDAMKTKGPHFIDAKVESLAPMMVAMHRQAYEAANS
ncbi:acetolactate synthase large subunit [Thermodesulfobacteriota bacterium]